jgi:hypothetical protein
LPVLTGCFKLGISSLSLFDVVSLIFFGMLRQFQIPRTSSVLRCRARLKLNLS